jgi:hypothetical protein
MFLLESDDGVAVSLRARTEAPVLVLDEGSALLARSSFEAVHGAIRDAVFRML